MVADGGMVRKRPAGQPLASRRRLAYSVPRPSSREDVRHPMPSPRQRFLDYVRRVPGARPLVSPFLPQPELVARTLRYLGLPDEGDPVANEIRLAEALDYEPMFMTDCSGLIFPWQEDPDRSDEEWIVSTLSTPMGEWTRRVSRRLGMFGDESGFPVQTEADHERLVTVCSTIREREGEIRRTFREWRQRVGEGGVIVIGHPLRRVCSP